MDEPIRVLHVDDDPDVLDRSRTSLEREHDGMAVVTATDATDGLALIDASTEIGDEREPTTTDCIVSEYQLPDMDGLAFFDAVREIDDSVPFLLFTDAGSEDVASQAVASGVAGYLRKDSPEPYALLANQIETVVSTARAQRQLLDSERVLRALHEATTDILLASDEAAVADTAVRITEDILGFPMVAIHRFDPSRRGLVPIAATGSITDRSMVDADEPLVWRAFETGEVRLYDDVRDHESTLGSQLSADLRSLLVIPIDDHGTLSAGSPLPTDFDGTDVSRARILVTTVRAVLDRIAHERELQEQTFKLERQNERLREFANIVAHDLRNPLSVAWSRCDLLRKVSSDESEHLDRLVAALERMDTIIDDVLTVARHGRTVNTADSISLAHVIERAWESVDTNAATLVVDVNPDHGAIVADEERLVRLFENLFRNAIEHGGPAVTVSVGTLSDANGFYVADDGPGIPSDNWDQILAYGYTTRDDSTGFGLAIVKAIAEAHGWELAVTEGDNGARFEITGTEPILRPAHDRH